MGERKKRNNMANSSGSEGINEEFHLMPRLRDTVVLTTLHRSNRSRSLQVDL